MQHVFLTSLLVILPCAAWGSAGSPTAGSRTSLVLLFDISVSTACQDRCRLEVSSPSCVEEEETIGSSHLQLTVATTQLQGYHTVQLPDSRTAATSMVVVSVHCTAGCLPLPAPQLELWRGSACPGKASGVEALPSTMLDSASKYHTVVLVNYGRPVLEVAAVEMMPGMLQSYGAPYLQEEQGGQACAETAVLPTAQEDAEEVVDLEMDSERLAGFANCTMQPMQECVAAEPMARQDKSLASWVARLVLVAWLFACPYVPLMLHRLLWPLAATLQSTHS